MKHYPINQYISLYWFLHLIDFICLYKESSFGRNRLQKVTFGEGKKWRYRKSRRNAYTFCVPEGKCTIQTINILKEAEVILKNIEKCNISSLMNKRSISFWLIMILDDFCGKQHTLVDFLSKEYVWNLHISKLFRS